jgi:hypothetical protein
MRGKRKYRRAAGRCADPEILGAHLGRGRAEDQHQLVADGHKFDGEVCRARRPMRAPAHCRYTW